MTEFKPGDVVVFNDEWFRRRRMPVPPVEERNLFTVRLVGDRSVVVDFPDYENNGRIFHQLIAIDWFELLTTAQNKETEGGDAEAASPSQ